MKVIMYPAITLDGFIADLNGECYTWINSDDEAGYEEAVRKARCVLLGRKTYEQYIDDPIDPNVIKFVYTKKTDQHDTGNVKFVSGTPQEVIKRITDLGFSELIISGGGEVNGACAGAGVVDEIIVSIYNVVLGEGIPLFGSHKPRLKLKLLSSSQEVEGIVKNHYEVVK